MHILYSQTNDTIIGCYGEWGCVIFERKLYKDTLFTSVPEESKVQIGVSMEVRIDSIDTDGYVHGIITNPIAFGYYIYNFPKDKYITGITKLTKHNRTKYYVSSPYESYTKKEKANWISICCQIDSIVDELYTGRPFMARYAKHDSNDEEEEKTVWRTDIKSIVNYYELTIFVFPYKSKN